MSGTTKEERRARRLASRSDRERESASQGSPFGRHGGVNRDSQPPMRRALGLAVCGSRDSSSKPVSSPRNSSPPGTDDLTVDIGEEQAGAKTPPTNDRKHQRNICAGLGKTPQQRHKHIAVILTWIGVACVCGFMMTAACMPEVYNPWFFIHATTLVVVPFVVYGAFHGFNVLWRIYLAFVTSAMAMVLQAVCFIMAFVSSPPTLNVHSFCLTALEIGTGINANCTTCVSPEFVSEARPVLMTVVGWVCLGVGTAMTAAATYITFEERRQSWKASLLGA